MDVEIMSKSISNVHDFMISSCHGSHAHCTCTCITQHTCQKFMCDEACYFILILVYTYISANLQKLKVRGPISKSPNPPEARKTLAGNITTTGMLYTSILSRTNYDDNIKNKYHFHCFHHSVSPPNFRLNEKEFEKVTTLRKI